MDEVLAGVGTFEILDTEAHVSNPATVQHNNAVVSLTTVLSAVLNVTKSSRVVVG